MYYNVTIDEEVVVKAWKRALKKDRPLRPGDVLLEAMRDAYTTTFDDGTTGLVYRGKTLLTIKEA